MSLESLLAHTIGLLEDSGLRYMITGSLASGYHGEYRATHDVDVVIDVSAVELDRLLDRLHAAGMYVDDEAARTALRERGQFNAIVEDVKVDFIIQKLGAFARSEFDRRIRGRLLGREASLVSPEDLILAKLASAAQLDSERQLRDVAGVVDAIGPALDRAYVSSWAERLGLRPAWDKLLLEMEADR